MTDKELLALCKDLTTKQTQTVLHDYRHGLAGLETLDGLKAHIEAVYSGDVFWWVLDKGGDPVHPATFGERPADGFPARLDPYTPYYHTASHLHGEHGSQGIHVYGTLEQARVELLKAQQGKSTLPWGTKII